MAVIQFGKKELYPPHVLEHEAELYLHIEI